MAKPKSKSKPKVVEFDVTGNIRTAPDPFAAVLLRDRSAWRHLVYRPHQLGG